VHAELGSQDEEDGGDGEAAQHGSLGAERGRSAQLVYQQPLTVRFHCPGRVAPLTMHCDSEYPPHEGSEINIWVPITNAYGSNTLWLESSPGAGDFATVEPGYGEILIFNRNRCRHYSLANETGETRVSFDLRAMPAEL